MGAGIGLVCRQAAPGPSAGTFRLRSRRQRGASGTVEFTPNRVPDAIWIDHHEGKSRVIRQLLSHCKGFCRCKRSRLRGAYDHLLAQDYFSWSDHLATTREKAVICRGFLPFGPLGIRVAPESAVKSGHCHIQIQPLRAKPGQYRFVDRHNHSLSSSASRGSSE
jgi:hypothetical protein